MNIVYIVGIVMAFFFTVFGIVVGFDMSTLQFSFSIGNLSNFVDLSSILIVIGGTLAVVVACYPKQIRSLPKHFKIMLHSNTFDPQVYVDQLTELAQIARKNGLLALEEKGNEQENSFFKQAIMLVVDNNDPERVRSILENEIEQTSERHQAVIAMYERGSNAAPAFGMIGTLIGLINMLKNLDGADMNSLGPDMAVALITTFYGSLLAHVVFNPIAANLTARDEEEILCRQIIMEGIMAIQSGENPKFLRERLLTFMNEKQREGGEAAEGADVLYTDVWASMGQESEAEKRRKIFQGYQINKDVMAVAAKDAMVMHCLPAHRGEEITAEVLEAHANEIFDEAENRLHSQKAVLVKCLGQ